MTETRTLCDHCKKPTNDVYADKWIILNGSLSVAKGRKKNQTGISDYKSGKFELCSVKCFKEFFKLK